MIHIGLWTNLQVGSRFVDPCVRLPDLHPLSTAKSVARNPSPPPAGDPFFWLGHNNYRGAVPLKGAYYGDRYRIQKS